MREQNMQSKKPLVSVIILNYNAGKLLEQCVGSVLKSSHTNLEIIVVDNASHDDSHKHCKEKFPSIQLIENKENLGYCAGNNVGIKQASGDYLAILNPDTIVEPNWADELLDKFSSKGEGLYQPKLLAADDHSRINTSGNMIHIFGFGYSKDKGMIDNNQDTSIKQIGYASGACLFTSKKIFDLIGLFDPFLFAYHDDLDLGWRAAQLGIKSYCVPSSIVYHAESFSFKWGPMKYYLLERNRWYCLLTHYSRSTLYKLLPGILVVEIAIFVFYLSKGIIKQKIRGYSDIIKNHKLIEKRYRELESIKKKSDKELISNFVDEMDIPTQVAGSHASELFNNFLRSISKMSRFFL